MSLFGASLGSGASIGILNKRVAIYASILVMALYLSYVASEFEYERIGDRIGPNVWPLMALGLLIVVSAYQLLRSVFLEKADTTPEKSADEEFTGAVEIAPHLVWLGIGLIVAYLIVMPFIGFFLATIPLVGLFIWLGGYRNWVWIGLLSLSLPLLFMFLFMRVVYVALPLGVSPFDSLSIAVISLLGVR